MRNPQAIASFSGAHDDEERYNGERKRASYNSKFIVLFQQNVRTLKQSVVRGEEDEEH